MSNDYSLRASNLIPFIGQRNYNKGKRKFYEEVLSRDIASEDVSIAKKWEIRHTGLALYNCSVVIGSVLLICNSLERLVNN